MPTTSDEICSPSFCNVRNFADVEPGARAAPEAAGAAGAVLSRDGVAASGRDGGVAAGSELVAGGVALRVSGADGDIGDVCANTGLANASAADATNRWRVHMIEPLVS
jgi:hypothetical protein